MATVAPRKAAGSSRRSAAGHQLRAAAAAVLFLTVVSAAAAPARRLLVDTDMDTDDVLALLYILKQNRSEFDVKVGAMSPSLPVSILACGRPCATCHRRSAYASGSIR